MEETLTYTAQLALRKHSAEAIKKKVTSALSALLAFFGLNLAFLPARENTKRRQMEEMILEYTRFSVASALIRRHFFFIKTFYQEHCDIQRYV